MINLIIKLLYSLGIKVRKLDLSGRNLIYSNGMKSIEGFKVVGGEFYNNNDVWFESDMVSVVRDGIEIKCLRDGVLHEAWNGKRATSWKSGMVNTRDNFKASMGVWIIKAKLNGGWPAIWLLKDDYIPEGYTKGQIIPEVDIVETIHDKFKHTIHWGFSNDNSTYRLYETGKNVTFFDNKFHDFAVDFLDNGYDFYIDGIKTASFRSNNPQFVSDKKNYLIINNAATEEDKEETTIVVKSIKVYK